MNNDKPLTPTQRKAVKAGRKGRIRKLIETLRAPQPKPVVVDEQLLRLLAMKKDEK
jgi:hypothetical protein